MARESVSFRLALVCLSVGFGASSCSSSTTSNAGTGTLTPTAFGNIYKFSNNVEMQGWTQDPDTTWNPNAPNALWVGQGADLSKVIDGGASTYLKNGCLLAVYQHLVGPDPQQCALVVMDFGTDANATAMFSDEQLLTGGSISIPGYDGSVAFAYSVISGITAFAHIKSFYFEVQLMGYGTDETSAAKVAAQFLDVLRAKTK